MTFAIIVSHAFYDFLALNIIVLTRFYSWPFPGCLSWWRFFPILPVTGRVFNPPLYHDKVPFNQFVFSEKGFHLLNDTQRTVCLLRLRQKVYCAYSQHHNLVNLTKLYWFGLNNFIVSYWYNYCDALKSIFKILFLWYGAIALSLLFIMNDICSKLNSQLKWNIKTHLSRPHEEPFCQLGTLNQK